MGRIVKIEKHPDADRLQICQIDIGQQQPLQIVTGADNVFEEALVPVALHNSHLPNGMHIKKGKLRGIDSYGMLCSGEELCLKEWDYPGAEVHGILILKEEYSAGTDMRTVIGLDDIIIDFSVTANRPDCQSVLGIAREVAVAFNTELKLPQPHYKTIGGNVHEYIEVSVEDADLCPRYYGRVVTNVRIAQSPDWMQKFLKAAGMRPINNIVDITNYVMLETGQPMHAFDLRDVRGGKIVVRRARDGETMTTLDGNEQKLSKDMLAIADADNPSCLAGIMGSLDSGIKDDTATIFFESAKFRRDSVRHTARTLGLRTESSARFEKGVDILNVEYAMERALQLIYELDAGDIVDGNIDCNNGLPDKRIITVSTADVNALLGIEIPADTMADILNRLSITTTLSGDKLTCAVPSFRDDIQVRADIAEEVIRIYGYDHIVGRPMHGAVVRGQKSHKRLCADNIKSRLIALGFYETMSYSFISKKAFDMLDLPENDSRRQTVCLLNPLGEEYSVMRTQLVSSMLNVISLNFNRKIPGARLFELDKVFLPKSDNASEQPKEAYKLSIGMYGDGEDFFTLKGIVEDVFSLFGIVPVFEASEEPFLHPGRQAQALYNDEILAVMGEVHPDTAERFGVNTRVYVAQISVESLFGVKQELVLYKSLPRFPAIERDLALVCDRNLAVAEIESTIRNFAGRNLESIALFDVYQGEQIEKGKKSVAYSLTFRSAQSTLKDEEVDAILNKIIIKLKEKGCILRS